MVIYFRNFGLAGNDILGTPIAPKCFPKRPSSSFFAVTLHIGVFFADEDFLAKEDPKTGCGANGME